VVKVLKMIPGIRRHPGHWVDLARNIDHEVRRFWQERPAAYLKVFVYQAIARMTGWFRHLCWFQVRSGCLMGSRRRLLSTATMKSFAEYVIAILPARVGVSEETAFFAFKFLGLDPTLGLILYVVLRVRTVFVNGLLTPIRVPKLEARHDFFRRSRRPSGRVW